MSSDAQPLAALHAGGGPSISRYAVDVDPTSEHDKSPVDAALAMPFKRATRIEQHHRCCTKGAVGPKLDQRIEATA
jgi:hypothetical protein